MDLNKVNHPVLIDPGADEEIVDLDNFQDIRIELQSTGHNVTSVLMNPRESLMDSMFDEFATDQSAPLDYSNPSTGGSKTSSSGSSSMGSNRNGHMVTPSSSGSRHGGSSQADLSHTEIEQLHKFIAKTKRLFKTYITIHEDDIVRNDHDFSSNGDTRNQNKSKRKSAMTINVDLRNCYRDIPDLFFRPTFSLKNQDMFYEALGSPTIDSMADSSIQGSEEREIFQDKLSRYLDLIEMSLLRQIWSQSPAFFRALDDIRALQHQFSNATSNLKHIRSKLQTVGEAVAGTTKKIPKMNRELKNNTVLHEKLVVMQQIVQARQAILAQLEVEDYNTALELISISKSLYRQHRMEELLCMRAIGAQIEDFDRLVGDVLCNKFVSIAIRWEEAASVAEDGDMDHLLYSIGTSSSSSSSIDGVSNGSNGNNGIHQNGKSVELQATLQHVLQSLIHSDRVMPALSVYKVRLLEAIKLITRTCVAEYLTNFDPSLGDFSVDSEYTAFNSTTSGVQSPSSGESTTPFGQKVREMPSETFLSCLSMCYEHVLLSLRKADYFHKFIARSVASMSNQAAAVNIDENVSDGASEEQVSSTGTVTDNNSSSTSNNSNNNRSSSSSSSTADSNRADELDGVIAISKSCLTSACELSQRCISQLINLRKESNSKMSLDSVKFLWEISLNFITSLESLCGSTGYIMRQCLLVQTKLFLDYFHESCKGRLVNALDTERWIQCDVSADRQREIDKLSSGKAFLHHNSNNSSNNTSTTQLSNMSSESALSSMGSNSNRTSSSSLTGMNKRSKDKDAKPVVIDGVEYKVVWSVMLVADIVLSYLDVAFYFAPVTKDVVSKAVEMLRLFNGRTKQLVLGAQAIQSSARLKSISAKHLAITGQSLRLVIALIPHIRAALLAHIPSNQHLLLTELDRISHEYVDHHSQIVGKFVGIVSDFVDASSSKLRNVDWDKGHQNPTHSSQAVNPCNEYFEEVQRNVSALHRVLQSTLPPEQVKDVFSRIFSLLNRKIPSHFDEIMPHTLTGKQRILDEATLLESALSKLKVVDTVAISIEDTIRKKYCI